MNLYDKFRVKPSKVNLNKISADEREHGWHDHDKLED